MTYFVVCTVELTGVEDIASRSPPSQPIYGEKYQHTTTPNNTIGLTTVRILRNLPSRLLLGCPWQ